MPRQKTDWGYIDWLEENMDESRAALNVGVVTIFPHAHMNPHIHFTEQVIYTLQGTGYSLINGKKIDMSIPGEILHWEASVIHEMYNEGEEEFKHLMVSCPDMVKFDPVHPDGTGGCSLSGQEAEEYLLAAVSGTCEQFLNTLHYSYAIFNASGMLAKRTRVFPEFCCLHCMEEISSGEAACMRHCVCYPFYEEMSFECPYGATVFCIPIVFHGAFLGYIQGGYAHMHIVPEREVYIMPESSIQGAKILLRQIAKAMTDYCEVYQFKKQLSRQELELADTHQYQEVLIENLRNAENTMTDLKINNHFLFNTLNQMASMALGGGMVSLYQSILDLSCLFSSAVRNNSSMVTLTKEYEYLNAYLKLQKLRYGERLFLNRVIETDMEGWKVPFNFLMPIAENAFIHGFSQEEDKRFSLAIREQKEQLVFVMENNGTRPSREECGSVMNKMRENSSHGLAMVYRKLYSVYGENFSIEFAPGVPDGVRITIALQAERIL